MSSTTIQKRRKIEEGKQSHIDMKRGLQDKDLYQLKESDLSKATSVKNTVVPQHYTSQMEEGGSFSQSSSTKSSTAFNFTLDQGGNQKGTPYKSLSRVHRLLGNTPFASDPDRRQNSFLKKNGLMESKPSSVTTACTYAPNEMSATKSVSSSRYGNSGLKKKRSGTETVINISQNDKQKKETTKKSQTNQKAQVGSKRQAPAAIEQMEYIQKLTSRNSKFVIQDLKLRNKRTGEIMPFALYQAGGKNYPTFLEDAIVVGFDMKKLEVEYDYDTDSDQMKHSKTMLVRELQQAIDFFVMEDPIKLVDNVLIRA